MLGKRILAGVLALAMVLPLVACGNEAEESSQSDKVTVPLDQFTTTSGDGEGGEEAAPPISALPDDAVKTLKWMANYDLNPAADADRSTSLVLFEDVCGGKIEWVQTSWATQYTDLANAVLGNNAPDMFPYSTMSFPMHVAAGFFQSIEDVVDFNDPLWSDMKETADQYVLNGEHYVAPIASSASVIMAYNKDGIEEYGLEDPWELYQAGEWTWDKWVEIMEEWVSYSTEEAPKFGVNGWYQPQLVQQTGKTMVNYVDGKFVQNLFDPDIERVETLIYDLAKNGLNESNWYGNARNCFKSGKSLFYVMGAWALTGTTNGPKEDSNWGICPMPSDPNNTSGQKIASVDLTAYMWVNGSTSADALKMWYNCCRMAETDETYREVSKQKFFADNPYWTEEMYEGMIASNSDEHLKIFDYAFGISTVMSDETAGENRYSVTKKLYEFVTQYDESGTQYTWTQVRDTYLPVVETELADLNAKIAALQN